MRYGFCINIVNWSCPEYWDDDFEIGIYYPKTIFLDEYATVFAMYPDFYEYIPIFRTSDITDPQKRTPISHITYKDDIVQFITDSLGEENFEENRKTIRETQFTHAIDISRNFDGSKLEDNCSFYLWTPDNNNYDDSWRQSFDDYSDPRFPLNSNINALNSIFASYGLGGFECPEYDLKNYKKYNFVKYTIDDEQKVPVTDEGLSKALSVSNKLGEYDVYYTPSINIASTGDAYVYPVSGIYCRYGTEIIHTWKPDGTFDTGVTKLDSRRVFGKKKNGSYEVLSQSPVSGRTTTVFNFGFENDMAQFVIFVHGYTGEDADYLNTYNHLVMEKWNEQKPKDKDPYDGYDWVIFCEDLGGPSNWDFNDLVANVNIYNEYELCSEYYDQYLVTSQTVKINPLAAGGTLPIYLMMTDPIDGNTYQLGPEFHEWFGQPFDKQYNTKDQYSKHNEVLGDFSADMTDNKYSLFEPSLSFKLSPVSDDDIFTLSFARDEVWDDVTGELKGLWVLVDRNNTYQSELAFDMSTLGDSGVEDQRKLIPEDLYRRLRNDPDIIMACNNPRTTTNYMESVAPMMLCTDYRYRWCRENVHIADAWPNFVNWLQNPYEYPWDPNSSEGFDWTKVVWMQGESPSGTFGRSRAKK